MMRAKKIRCRRCKELYDYAGGIPETCPPCSQLLNEWRDRVRLLVWESPGITAAEVHLKTEVPFNMIMEMIRKGDILVVPSKPGEEARAISAIKAMQEKGNAVAKVADAPLQVTEEAELPTEEIEEIEDIENTEEEDIFKFHTKTNES